MKKTRTSATLVALRKRAEQIIRERRGKLPDDDELDLIRLTHELEVQHIELELQNEELRRANTGDLDVYFSCLKKIALNGAPSTCELRLVGSNGRLVHVQMEAVVRRPGGCSGATQAARSARPSIMYPAGQISWYAMSALLRRAHGLAFPLTPRVTNP